MSNPTKEEQFQNYNWDKDEFWQKSLSNLEFPGNATDYQREKFILKRKVKHYQKNVDPDYKPVETSTSSTSQPSTSESDSYTSSGNGPSISDSGSSSSSSSSSSSGGYSYGAYTMPPPPSRRPIGGKIGQLLSYYYLISQWFVFINCILMLISRPSYYRALIAAAIMHGVAIIQNNGIPKFNMYYAQGVIQDSNTMCAFYAILFFISSPNFVFISPVFLRSLWMGVVMLNGALKKHSLKLHAKLEPQLNKILSKKLWFETNIPRLEVYVGIFLIFACFYMSGAIILTILYWQIMQVRYMMDANTKKAFSQINKQIENLLSRIPFLLNLYQKFTNYLYSIVDPKKLQAKMEQNQQGFKPKCTIM